MRPLALVLIVIGVCGFVFGIVQRVQDQSGAHATPFMYETAGGPGPMFAGLILVTGGLVLLGYDRRR